MESWIHIERRRLEFFLFLFSTYTSPTAARSFQHHADI